jgi:aminoglycoside 6'-N-acetyltransferase I
MTLESASVDILELGTDDGAVLDRVADGVFDHRIDPRWSAEFFADPRHHLIVAVDNGTVVGMITAVHYVHPDKAPQLWINEVGVAESHRRRGIGRRMLEAMLARGKALGCTEAWLGTEEDNLPARRLYESVESSAEPFMLYSFRLDGRRR